MFARLREDLRAIREAVEHREARNHDGPHWWRPLMGRPNEDRMSDGGRLRLIGLELRMTDVYGLVEEVQMVPLAIELVGTCNAAATWAFGPCTLHTSAGDVAIPAVRLLAYGG